MQPQPPSQAPPYVVAEPQFATVTFVGEDDAPGSTFRVPLSSSTTVSRLAKDAMKRLVLSRPSEERHRQCPAIVVTEVFVGGGAQPKAEVFAQDIVQQVVLVKEEIIFMKLRAAASSAASSRLSTPPPPPPPATSTQTSTKARESTSDTVSAQAPSVAVPQSVPKPQKEVAHGPIAPVASKGSSEPASHSEHTTTAVKQATKSAVPAFTRVSEPAASDVPSEVKSSAANMQPKRPGWGPEAHAHFADNYVSTPGKRRRNAARKQPASATTGVESQDSKRGKAEATTGTATSLAAATVESGEALAAQSTEAERGLRWGPEASKSFPANYVSSPEKLARLARRQRQQQQQQQMRATSTSETPSSSATAVSAAAPPQKARVSRELVFPAEASDAGRATVGHAVEREVISVEEETAVELPKGWGAESLRYFDPNTYCDDPKKARLMPNMDLSRPTRQRRPASP